MRIWEDELYFYGFPLEVHLFKFYGSMNNLNSNIETRSTKQIQNLNDQLTKTQGLKIGIRGILKSKRGIIRRLSDIKTENPFKISDIGKFDFRICFEFRASDFEFSELKISERISRRALSKVLK